MGVQFGGDIGQILGTARFGQQSMQQGQSLANMLASGFIRRTEERQRQDALAKQQFANMLGLGGATAGAVIGARMDEPAVGAAIGGAAGQAIAGQVSQGSLDGIIGILAQRGKEKMMAELEREKIQATKDIAQDKLELTGAQKLLESKVKAVESKTEQENVLRKEFNPILKKFNEVLTANNKVDAALKKNNSAGDLAGIFAFMKTIDPGSVVRESEFKNAEQSMGMLQRIGIFPNKILAGERLSQKQRKEFIDMAKRQFAEEVKSFKSEYERFQVISENQELDKSNIFGKFNTKEIDTLISELEPMQAEPMQAEVKDTNTSEALKWLRENPNDPSAPAVRQKLVSMGILIETIEDIAEEPIGIEQIQGKKLPIPLAQEELQAQGAPRSLMQRITGGLSDILGVE